MLGLFLKLVGRCRCINCRIKRLDKDSERLVHTIAKQTLGFYGLQAAEQAAHSVIDISRVMRECSDRLGPRTAGPVIFACFLDYAMTRGSAELLRADANALLKAADMMDADKKKTDAPSSPAAETPKT